MWPIFWLVFPIRLRAAIAMKVGSEILVVKHKIYFGQWNLPGGGVKFGEPPIKSVIRESREELGVVLKDGQLIELTESFKTIKEYGIMSRQKIYLANLDQKPNIKANREIEAYRWAHMDDASLGADARAASELL